MPKIVRSNSKGLYQKAGKGSFGFESLEMSADTTVSVAVANYDATVTCPANCVITDIGFIATSAFDVGTSAVKFSAGTNGTNMVGATTLNNTNTDIAAGVAISVKAANIVHASGNAIAFAAAAPLHSSSERTITLRCSVTSAVLTAAASFRAYIKYVDLSE